MAGRTGLEPAASCVTGKRYNQLNYRPVIVPSFGRKHWCWFRPFSGVKVRGPGKVVNAPAVWATGACPGQLLEPLFHSDGEGASVAGGGFYHSNTGVSGPLASSSFG
jgi:hypothetical protein